MIETRATHLASLRRTIGATASSGTGCAALPEPCERVAALGRSGLHELVPAAHGDAAAVTGLALAALNSPGISGALLWVSQALWPREHGRPCARGMQSLGLDPGRVLLVCAPRAVDVLWCTEEAVRSAAVSAVLAEVAEADFTATRRLALACETTGVPVLLCRPAGRMGCRSDPTAARTRWRVASAASRPDRFDPRAPGPARWHLTLERARPWPAAVGQGFDLEFDNATLSVPLADGLASGPAAAGQPGNRARTG